MPEEYERKVFKLGSSYVVALPPNWARNASKVRVIVLSDRKVEVIKEIEQRQSNVKTT